MTVNKKTQFWGIDENDDRLLRQIIAGQKTATACPLSDYFAWGSAFDDGSFELGDVVDVYDLKGQLRCRIEITEVYRTKFGEIPEKLWRGECNSSAEAFQEDHRVCWSEYTVNDDFDMMVNHFKLLEVIRV
jgi:uncharacterized protein YhfF